MELSEARIEYNKGNITFYELERIFFKKAPEEEKSRFWKSPVYDRAYVVIGKTKTEIDQEWNELIIN